MPFIISIILLVSVTAFLKYTEIWDDDKWWAAANKFGIICTVVSTFFAIWIFYYAQSINKRIHKRDRIPEIAEELHAKVVAIRQGLKKWDSDKDDVIDLFSQVQGLLENLKPKLNGHYRRDAKLIIEKISRKPRFLKALPEISRDDGWLVQRDLQRFVTHLRAMHQDNEAERL